MSDETAKTETESKKEPKKSAKSYSKPSTPIGTYHMPGGGAAYSQAPKGRGIPVLGVKKKRHGG